MPCSKACIWSFCPVTVRSEPASRACPAAGPDGPDGHVAAAAVAAVATVNAPAAMRATALDRLPGIFRCRDKGTFRWFACHAICFTPIATATATAAGICACELARVRAPG